MNGAKGWVIALSGLWLAAGLQAGLAPYLTVLGAAPDFPLIVLTVVCLFASRTAATCLGFLAGLLYGAVAGANLAHYVISRTVTGFGAGWANAIGFEPNVWVAGLAAAVGTLVSQLLLLLLAPPASIPAYLGDTIGSAMVNGVLAMPVYALLNRFLRPPTF